MKKKWIRTAGAILFCYAAVVFWQSAGASDQKNIKWHTYNEGMKLGRKKDKKIFLHFWAEWCGYCTRMRNETFRAKSVISYLNQNFISVRVDFDREQTTAAKYKVRGLPDTHFLTEEGKRISNLPGFIRAELLIGILKYLHTDSFKKMSFTRFYKGG